MRTVRRTVAVATALVILFLSPPPPVRACSFPSPEPVFTSLFAPDDVEGYVNGHVGLLEPTFARSYLFAAWRQLQGRPFGPDDQRALLHYWKSGGDPLSDPGSGRRAWDEARTLATRSAATPGDERMSRIGNLSYVNCSDDAFRTAAAHLRDKAARLGAASPAVATWLSAQDEVFSNCTIGRRIPEPLPPNVSSAERADRDYQIAAALFYAEDWADAETRFRTIAADPASPWRDFAPYLAARCLVRRATLTAGADRSFEDEPLREAQAQLAAILADAKLSRSHPAARSLLAFVRFKTEPEERLAELSRELSRGGQTGSLALALKDYKLLLDRIFEGAEAGFRYDVDADEMTAWIAAVQGRKLQRDAVARWRETRSVPWLLPALMSTHADDPWRAEIVAAAAKVDTSSPAYATAAYHRVRLLVQGGLADDARRALAELHPEERRDWNVSTRNAFSVFRLSLARDLTEVAGAVARVPVPDSEGIDWGQRFTAAGAAMLDRNVPLRRLRDLGREEALSPALRARLVRTAWLRAVLAGRFDDAAVAARDAETLQGSHVFDPYLATKTDDDRRFEAALVVLEHPEVTAVVPRPEYESLDGFGWDWRIPGVQVPHELDLPARTDVGETVDRVPLPHLFSEGEVAAIATELAPIDDLGTARIWICQESIRRARTQPKDPRVPETLYRAIQTTRLTYDKQVSAWSHRAFTTLHRQYPKSPWTARAKYWY
jgi:hypothetical protein